MKVGGVSAVGVVLPLFPSLVFENEDDRALASGLEPFQLLWASRATRTHTPCGGMPLFPV